MSKKRVFRALSLLLAMCLLVAGVPMFASAANIDDVFTDPAFRAVICAELSINEGDTIDAGMEALLAALTDLDLSDQGVTDLSGLELLTGLTTLDLSGNALWNVTLPALPVLAALDVSNCSLRTLDYSQCASLTQANITAAGNYLTAFGQAAYAPAFITVGPIMPIIATNTLDLSSYVTIPSPNTPNKGFGDIVWTSSDPTVSFSGGVLSTTAATSGSVSVEGTIVGGNAPNDTMVYFNVNVVPIVGINGITLDGNPTAYEPGAGVLLNPVIDPANATYQTIEWSFVTNNIGASLSYIDPDEGTPLPANQAILSTPNDGDPVVVRATVKNDSGIVIYSKDFTFTSGFNPVEEIVYNGGNATLVNVPLQLDASAEGAGGTTPTYSEIEWVILSGPAGGAGITNGSTFTATKPGTYRLNAVVADGKAMGTDFSAMDDNPTPGTYFVEITVGTVDVLDIVGLPENASAGIELNLSGTAVAAGGDTPSYSEVKFALVGTPAGVTLNNGVFLAANPGTYQVTAYVENGANGGTQDFTKTFTIIVSIIPVNDIIGLPSGLEPGGTLSAAAVVVQPEAATYKTIVWDLVNTVQYPTTGVIVTGTAPNVTAVLDNASTGSFWLRATIAGGKADGTDFVKYFQVTVSSNPVNVLNAAPVSGSFPYTYTVNTAPVTVRSQIIGMNPSIPATAQDILWSVSRSDGGDTSTFDIDYVTSDGKEITFEAGLVGTYTLTATILNGMSGGGNFTRNFTVYVRNIAAKIDSISPAAITAKTATDITAAISPADATVQGVSWEVTVPGTTGITAADLNYAAGSKTVTVNAPKPGTMTLKAIILGGGAAGEDIEKEFKVTVTNIGIDSPSGITGLPNGTQVVAGSSFDLKTLSLSVSPSNATNKDVTDWRVINSNGTGASVADGVFTAAQRGNGTGIVICQARVAGGNANGTEYIQQFTIEVLNKAVTSVTPSPDPLTTTVGSPLTLAGNVIPADATKNKVTKWVVVDQNGTGAVITNNSSFKATAPGTATVQAIVAGGTETGGDFASAPITVTVYPQSVTGINGVKSVSNTLVSLALGGVSISPAATTFTSADINWTVTSAPAASSGNEIANNLSANAMFVPEVPGEYVLLATIANGKSPGVDFTKSFTIKVSNVPVTTIVGVPGVIRPADSPYELNDGSTSLFPANSTAYLLGKKASWSIADAGTTDAAVTPGGTFTVTKEGTVQLKATVEGGLADGSDFEKTFTVFISINDVMGIKDVTTTAVAGVPTPLQGTIDPPDASRTIEWFIFDAASTGATIENGVLTAPRAGIIVVEARIAGGNPNGTDFSKLYYIEITGTTNPDDDSPKQLPTTSLTVNVRKTATIDKSAIKGGIKSIYSADSKYASVDGNGTVTGKRRGSATIYYETTTGQWGQVNVKVTYNFWQWLLVIFLFGWIWLPLK